MKNIKEELERDLREYNKSINDIIAFRISLGEYQSSSFQVFGEQFSWELIPETLEYDSGYGTRELFGTILFKDNSWLERVDNDGKECWEHTCPPIVSEIINVNKV